MPVAALVGGLASIAGNGISQYIADSNAEKSFNRQKELMALQQQYAVQNWNRENNYNSPAEQMKRLKEAGLNPNLVYGNGAAGLQSGSISSPAAASAPMSPTMDFSRAVDSAVQAAVGIANAKKAGSETIAQKIENEYNQKTLNDRIEAAGLANNWTKEQVTKTKEETAYLQQQFADLTATINLKHLEAKERNKVLDNWQKRFDNEMRDYDDRHKISYQEEKRLRETFDDFKRQIKLNADELEFRLSVDKSFAATEKALGVAGQFLKLLRFVLK